MTMLKKLAAGLALFAVIGVCSINSAQLASAQDSARDERTITEKQAAAMIWADAVDFYEKQIESGRAEFFGVQKDYEDMLRILFKYEVYLTSNFSVLQDLLTPVKDNPVEFIGGPITGTQALNTEGPLESVYTKHERKNVFGGVIGTAGLCAKPFKEEGCRIGFGENDGVAPYYDVPRGVAACTVTGQQCGWIQCPGIEGWSDGWQYRCCQVTFVCEQDWFLFTTSVTITDTIYAATCG